MTTDTIMKSTNHIGHSNFLPWWQLDDCRVWLARL